MKYLTLLCFLIACSPVKQVLRDPVKTQVVIDAYLKNYTFFSDTIYSVVRGDTVVQVVTNSDTAYVFDSLYVPIEKIVTKNINRYINKTDTIVRTIIDRSLLSSLQRQNAAQSATIDQLTRDIGDMKTSRNKFQLWFYILLGSVIGVGVLWAYLKLKAK